MASKSAPGRSKGPTTPGARLRRLAAALLATAIPFAGCGLPTQGTAEPGSLELCTVDANCDDQDSCTTDTCGPDGTCLHDAVPDGSSPAQVAGDCATAFCKAGVESKVDDNADVPDDGESCTFDTCNAGVASHTSAQEGSECKKGTAAGKCVGGKCTPICDSMKLCDDQNPCTTDECNLTNGTCVFTDLNGIPTPLVTPMMGDCHVHLCVGGKDIDVVDDTDVKKTPTDCDAELCNEGNPSNPPLPAGAACSSNGGNVCDALAGCVECNQPADCVGLPQDDACQTRTCGANKCGQSFQPSMTVVPGVQTNGDCKRIVCDGAGKSIAVPDGSDLPNDNNACTTDTCSGSSPVNASLPQGASCGVASVCDGAPVNPKCQGCNVALDCGGYVSDECKQTTCVAGTCGTAFTAVGTPIAMQTAHDCKVVVCDGSGATKVNVANGDKPVDGLVCTQDTCTAGVPSNPPVAINTVCPTGFCDGVNACVQCNNAGQCPAPPVCVNATCSSHVCGTQNAADGTVAPAGSQTSGDCKEVDCNGAGGIKTVASAGDLPNDNNACTADSCVGTLPTFTPTAPGSACVAAPNKTVCDGGGACVQCVMNAQCTFPQTCGGGGVTNACGCTSSNCGGLGKTCGSAPDGCGGTLNCNDGVKNGTETDVDCGGSGTCANKCAASKQCGVGGDCNSTFCADGVCCGSACAGTCFACTAALKGSGADGTCGVIKVGTDPDGECTDQGATSCGTNGSCDGAGACQKYPNGTGCNDGAACTKTDVCTAGGCAGTAYTCAAPDQCHDAGTCNGDGTCSFAKKADSTPCNDGNACTQTDVCTAGACGGALYACGAPDQCHQGIGTCNGDGTCSFTKKADNTACNDGDACTQTDVCTIGACAGTSYACGAPDQCHQGIGTCNGDGTCSFANKMDTTACDDGVACTQTDVCTMGACAGASYACGAPDQCHQGIGTCNGDGTCSFTNKMDGTACDDGLFCNGTDICTGGVCGGTGDPCVPPKTCDELTKSCIP